MAQQPQMSPYLQQLAKQLIAQQAGNNKKAQPKKTPAQKKSAPKKKTKKSGGLLNVLAAVSGAATLAAGGFFLGSKNAEKNNAYDYRPEPQGVKMVVNAPRAAEHSVVQFDFASLDGNRQTQYASQQVVYQQQPVEVQAPRTATGGFDALCNTIVNLAGSVTKAADASFYALDAVGDAYDAANRISLSTTARKTERRKMNANAEKYELNNLSKKVSIARQIGAEVRSMENHRANLRKKTGGQSVSSVIINGGNVSGKSR